MFLRLCCCGARTCLKPPRLKERRRAPSLGPSLRRSAWRGKSSRWISNRLGRNFCLADVCVSAMVGGRGHFKCLGLEAAQSEKMD
jgi:hypothetical protein